MKIKIGTRQSLLALKQTQMVFDEIRNRFPEIEIEIVKKETKGDKNLSAALIEFGGKGAFVSEFEEAILENRIDIAVHSGKDLPYKIADGLEIACVLKRENPSDIIIWRKNVDKKKHTIIGTSSPRRSLQVKELYDCETKLLRGNVPTRLEKLKNGEYDAVILAAAGLKRLDLISEGVFSDSDFEYEWLSEEKMCPAGNQGIIAIECKKDNEELKKLLKQINNEKTFLEFEIERYILEKLQCGCHEPTAVFSKIENDNIKINFVSQKNEKVFRIEKSGKLENRFEIANSIIELSQKQNSCVYLVGSGPGDETLLTQRAIELIKDADSIVYDNLANPIALLEAKETCKKIFVGKIPNAHSKTQDEINQILIDLAKSGDKKIVRLKGGDPFVFGRGGEEINALQKENIDFQVIPGITSAISALEYAGIPVTHRKDARSFHVITGHTADENDENRFIEYAKLSGTLVFLMGIANLSKIVKQLILGGMDLNTPVSIVENGTTIFQRRTNGTLQTIEQIAKENNVKNPAIIVVGKVASFEMVCKNLPLFDKRICVTGTKSFIQKISPKLKDNGALIFSAPIVETILKEYNFELLPQLEEIEWLIFTSSNGVRFFFEYLRKNRIDFRKLSQIKFCVVGSGTEETLNEFGFYADFLPSSSDFTVEKMAIEFSQKYKNSISKKICVLRAENGSLDLNRIFEENKISFLDIPIYCVKNNDFVLKLVESSVEAFDFVTFGSSSGVNAFFRNQETLKNLKSDTKFICIGNKTQKTLERYVNSKNILVAREFTADGIIERFFS